MLENSLLDLREKMRIGAWAFVRITHVNMSNRCPGFKCFVRGFNLLVGGDRDCRRVNLAGDRPCDSDGNYGGVVIGIIGPVGRDESSGCHVAPRFP